MGSYFSVVLSRAKVYFGRHKGGGLLLKLYFLYKREGFFGIRQRFLELFRGIQIAPGSNGHDRFDYAYWLKLKECDHPKVWCGSGPKISIIVPVYRPDFSWFCQCIESIRNQSYKNFELCIVDDGSNDEGLFHYLNDLLEGDERIKVFRCSKNSGISSASNIGLDMCTSEWVGFVDHDDVVDVDALYYVAEEIALNPAAKLLYSDEDKIDSKGVRSSPYFKSGWNKELMLSHNMIGHFCVISTSLVKRVGGFRPEYDGAQDYDLLLRCTEGLAQNQIIHIGRILYHWRAHNNSTAAGIENKPFALNAGKRALDDYFHRNGIFASASINCGYYLPAYSLVSSPLVSIVIPTRDAVDLVRQCIYSIIEYSTYKNFEVIIIDNGSCKPETLDFFLGLSRLEFVKIIRLDCDFNYSFLNNFAVKLAAGDYICFMNNDVEVISNDWIEQMLFYATQPEIGAVGAKLLYPDGTIQHAGVVLGIGGVAGHAFKRFPRGSTGYFNRAVVPGCYSAVTGACLMVSKDKFMAVGGFDELNLVVDYNDVDFCLRLSAAGYRNVFNPLALLYHHESATRGDKVIKSDIERFSRERDFMLSKWGREILHDQFYNENLTLHYEDFSFKWHE